MMANLTLRMTGHSVSGLVGQVLLWSTTGGSTGSAQSPHILYYSTYYSTVLTRVYTFYASYCPVYTGKSVLLPLSSCCLVSTLDLPTYSPLLQPTANANANANADTSLLQAHKPTKDNLRERWDW